MKTSSQILACIFILLLCFGSGVWFERKYKKCPECEVRIDTVLVPGKTIVVDNPKPVKTYPVVKRNFTTQKYDTISDEKLTQIIFVSGQENNPSDSIRIYKGGDSLVTVIDSVHGVLLRQTIIHKPTKQITKTVTIRKDSLIIQRGFYLGGSAGINSIRLEAEYLDKKGWSYGVGYDLINRTPVARITRKIW